MMCYNDIKNIKEVVMHFFKLFVTGLISVFKGMISFVKCFFTGVFTILTIFPKYFVLGIISIFSKKEKKKISKHNKKTTALMMGLSLSVYLICVFLISRWYVQGLKIKYLSKDIIASTEIIEEQNDIPEEKNDDDDLEEDNTEEEENPEEDYTYYPNDYWDYMSVPFMEVNFNDLLNKNPDTVAWLKVEGTKVNYPVVQSDDNEYYLTHAFNRSDNAGGWIFADYRVDFDEFGKNTIIYGHNMNNKTMFGSVPSMLYDSYLNNSGNYYIKMSTPTTNTIWKVFSIYTIEPEVYYLKVTFNSEPYDKFLSTIKERSIYNFGIDVTTDDKILTLSTCDNTGTKRVAVHAKMISIEYK